MRLMMSLSLIEELLSLVTMANCWNVDSEPTIDPPIQEEYLRCQSKRTLSSSPYLLSSLWTLSYRPWIMEVPPQKMAFFMIYCLRSSLHR